MATEENGTLEQEAGNRSEISVHGVVSLAPRVTGEGVSEIGADSGCTPGGYDRDFDHEAADFESGFEEDAAAVAKNLESGTPTAPNSVDELKAGSHGEVEVVTAETSTTPDADYVLTAGDQDKSESDINEAVLQSNGGSRNQEDGDQREVSDLYGEVAVAATLPAYPEAVCKDDFLHSWKDVVVLKAPSSAPGGQCTTYIVGTAHVSLESCKEVANVIRTVKPQVVFIELCSSRVAMLMPQTLQVPTVAEMLESWRSKKMNALGIIYGWFLSKVSAKLEVFPGSEFRVAYEGAMACGAKVTLGDRPVQITLRRTWAKMSLWEKTTLIYCMVFRSLFLPSAEELSEMVEGMKDNDMVTRVIQEMGKRLPTVMETLIFERDLYMTAMLRLVAKDYTSVVAVVGKGHVPGITESWDKTISIESLMVVPDKKSSSRKLWGLLAMSVGGVAIMSAVYCSRKRYI